MTVALVYRQEANKMSAGLTEKNRKHKQSET